MPHMKAMNVLFHLLYGSLFCSKGLQSDRSECLRMLGEAGTLNEHAEVGLFVPSLNHTYQYANPIGPKSKERIFDSADIGCVFNSYSHILLNKCAKKIIICHNY